MARKRLGAEVVRPLRLGRKGPDPSSTSHARAQNHRSLSRTKSPRFRDGEAPGSNPGPPIRIRIQLTSRQVGPPSGAPLSCASAILRPSRVQVDALIANTGHSASICAPSHRQRPRSPSAEATRQLSQVRVSGSAVWPSSRSSASPSRGTRCVCCCPIRSNLGPTQPLPEGWLEEGPRAVYASVPLHP
jgi:hypothetical protein